jgi:O-antigen ligase
MRVSSLDRQLSPESKGPGWQKFVSALKSLALAGVVTALGILVGTQMVASPEQESFVVAVISCLAYLFLAIANPVLGLVVTLVTYPLNYHFSVLELGYGIPNISADRLIIFILAALFFFQITTGKRKLRYPNLAGNLAALIFLGAYYSSFHNFDWSPNRALMFILNAWILPLLVYFLLSNMVVNKRQIHIILNLLLILAVYSALYMIYENVTGHVLLEDGQGPRKLFYADTSLRITRGMYGTTTTFGNLYNLLLPVDIYYLLKTRSPGKKTWYLLVFGLLLIGVFLTYKRSVWLGMLLSFLVIQFFYPQFRKFFLIILVVTAVVMTIFWDRVMTTEAVETRITQTDDWESANGRTQRWDAAMDYWWRNPIFGSGFRSYTQGQYEQAENLYIHLLASGGLLAFIPFVTMLLIIFGNSIRIFWQARWNQRLFADRYLMPIFWGSFVSYFFMAYFGSGVEGHAISNYTLFTLMGTLVGSQVPLLGQPKETPTPLVMRE